MQLEKLALKISKRDKKAFEELYGKLSRLVFSVCLGIVRNKSIAEDLTQDTFVSVWEKIESYGGKGFKAWVITIARNKSLNALRTGGRECFVDFSENEYLGGGYTIDEQSETRTVLDAALKILPDDGRQILLMRNSGMKAKEIANLLGIPRGTVSWKYAEAIDKIKEYLEEGQ